VWLYFRFALSYRDVEELLAERGVTLTYETVRQWCRTFGQGYANALRRQPPTPRRPMAPRRGLRPDQWRAASPLACRDQDGAVLDLLVQSRRDKEAAVKFLRRLLKRLTSVPRVVITDKLAGYGAAQRAVLPLSNHFPGNIPRGSEVLTNSRAACP